MWTLKSRKQRAFCIRWIDDSPAGKKEDLVGKCFSLSILKRRLVELFKVFLQAFTGIF